MITALSGMPGQNPRLVQYTRYFFKIYGLDARLDCAPGSEAHTVINAMKGHVLQFGQTEAFCQR